MLDCRALGVRRHTALCFYLWTNIWLIKGFSSWLWPFLCICVWKWASVQIVRSYGDAASCIRWLERLFFFCLSWVIVLRDYRVCPCYDNLQCLTTAPFYPAACVIILPAVLFTRSLQMLYNTMKFLLSILWSHSRLLIIRHQLIASPHTAGTLISSLKPDFSTTPRGWYVVLDWIIKCVASEHWPWVFLNTYFLIV